MEVCNRYVEKALGMADLIEVTSLAIDETSRALGHTYVTLAADADKRCVLFVTECRGAYTIEALSKDLRGHGCTPDQITSVSIDMSPAFIKEVTSELVNAQISFDKFHVIARANAAVDKTRRVEQRPEKSLKGMRWTLLSDAFSLTPAAGASLYGLLHSPKLTRTARAWTYKVQLRVLLDKKQINVLRDSLKHWCVCVMRSKVAAMKEVAGLVRRHMECIVAWAQTR